MSYKIPFNKPYMCGLETQFITEAVHSGHIAGDGIFTKKCHQFFEEKYGFQKCLLTTSCTHALEMAALLLDIKVGDEVIMPSFTFVSTANAFALRGATIVFADSEPNHPNIDAQKIEPLITKKTRAIVAVHYAGVACDMDTIMALADKYNIDVVEDAAQAIDTFYKSKPLGSFGSLSAFSFHETKNIIAGEGGMLVINNSKYNERAEIIREKGTNRSQFFRGAVDKYGWVDIGSSYLPSEIISAYLYAQLNCLHSIQSRRAEVWDMYDEQLQLLPKAGVQLPTVPKYSTNNYHMYFLICKNLEQRTHIIQSLKKQGILSVFHYQSLHKSSYFSAAGVVPFLPNSDKFTDCLLRLPLYFELSAPEQQLVINALLDAVK